MKNYITFLSVVSFTAFFLLLNALAFYSVAKGASLPSWEESRSIMVKCYSGFDVVVNLEASLGGSYSGKNVTSIGNSSSEYRREAEFNNLKTDSEGSVFVLGDDYSSYDSTGNEYSKADEDFFEESAFVGITLTVPLYSRKERLSRKEATNSQIAALADLYAKYEGHRATAAALNQETKIIKQIMLDGGQGAISAYYKMLADKEKSIALMRSSKRKIMFILGSCGYVIK